MVHLCWLQNHRNTYKPLYIQFRFPDTVEKRQGSWNLWIDFLLYLLDKRFGGSQSQARRFMEIIRGR